MEKNYMIAWKSLSNGRVGRGKHLLQEEEARQLAAELNREHPGFEHVAIHKDEENLLGAFSVTPQSEKILSLHSLPEITHAHAQSVETPSEGPAHAQTQVLSLEMDENANPLLDNELTGT